MLVPNRINIAGMTFSCVGHAALLGGFLWAISPAQPHNGQREAWRAPLVIEMIPLDQMQAHPSPRAIKIPVDDTAESAARSHRLAVESMQKPVEVAMAATRSGSLGAAVVPEPAATSASATAIASALDDYQRRLNELIARHSRYPVEARRQRLAGITQLAFRIDRGGALLDSWIHESSGSELLDSAALAALQRATPLPPVPPTLPSPMDFVVEIDSSTTTGLASNNRTTR
jgi:protein TonB